MVGPETKTLDNRGGPRIGQNPMSGMYAMTTPDVSFLLCYVCGNAVEAWPRIERWASAPDANGLGVVEACHEACDRERLTELEAGDERDV